MAVPVIDYQVLADTLLNNIAAAGGLAPGAAAGAGAAHGDTTVRYSGDHMDIERVESAMKKFLSENCVDTNATVMQNIRTFLDHVSNVFKIEVCLYDTRHQRRHGTTRSRCCGHQCFLQDGGTSQERVERRTSRLANC